MAPQGTSQAAEVRFSTRANSASSSTPSGETLYWAAQVRPHIGSCVLEVGTGIGVNTPYLNKGAKEWVYLELDAQMAAILIRRQRENQFLATKIIAGTMAELPTGCNFDSIIYIDVLEHIEDDYTEIAVAASRLCLGGKLIVLSPAHSSLFSPFDAAIGHFDATPHGLYERLRLAGLKLLLYGSLI